MNGLYANNDCDPHTHTHSDRKIAWLWDLMKERLPNVSEACEWACHRAKMHKKCARHMHKHNEIAEMHGEKWKITKSIKFFCTAKSKTAAACNNEFVCCCCCFCSVSFVCWIRSLFFSLSFVAVVSICCLCYCSVCVYNWPIELKRNETERNQNWTELNRATLRFFSLHNFCAIASTSFCSVPVSLRLVNHTHTQRHSLLCIQ